MLLIHFQPYRTEQELVFFEVGIHDNIRRVLETIYNGNIS
jgi:hypothetical protein